MDPNRPTEQQQSQSQREDTSQRGSQSHPGSSQSTGTLASHPDAFVPFLEPGTMRNDIARSSVPAPTIRETETESHPEYAVEVTKSQFLTPIRPPRVVTPARPNTAPATSSSGVTPLPPAIVSSRDTPTDNDANRTLHNSTYSNIPPIREPRRISSGPEQTLDRRYSTVRTGTGTEIDWIVPIEEKPPYREKSVAERLEPTLLHAIAEKNKYATKARLTGYALNIAIGLQILLGTLTTALSVVVKGSQTAVMTAVLGGFSTVVASYLARARGSNEPELSITRVKDLEQFIRECDAFKLDHGHVMGDKFDKELDRFRGRFEELLGNANGERKLSPV